MHPSVTYLVMMCTVLFFALFTVYSCKTINKLLTCQFNKRPRPDVYQVSKTGNGVGVVSDDTRVVCPYNDRPLVD